MDSTSKGRLYFPLLTFLPSTGVSVMSELSTSDLIFLCVSLICSLPSLIFLSNPEFGFHFILLIQCSRQVSLIFSIVNWLTALRSTAWLCSSSHSLVPRPHQAPYHRVTRRFKPSDWYAYRVRLQRSLGRSGSNRSGLKTSKSVLVFRKRIKHILNSVV